MRNKLLIYYTYTIKPVLLLLAMQNRKLFFKRNPKHTLNCLGFVSFCSYVILCLNNRVEQHPTAQLNFAKSMWYVTPVLFWHRETKISPQMERVENLPCGLNCLLEFLSVIKLQLVLAYGISDRVCCLPKPTGIMNWTGKGYKYFKANSSAELLRCLLTSKEFWVLKALQNGWRHETIVIKLSKLPNMNPTLCELEFSPLNLHGRLLVTMG